MTSSFLKKKMGVIPFTTKLASWEFKYSNVCQRLARRRSSIHSILFPSSNHQNPTNVFLYIGTYALACVLQLKHPDRWLFVPRTLAKLVSKVGEGLISIVLSLYIIRVWALSSQSWFWPLPGISHKMCSPFASLNTRLPMIWFKGLTATRAI